MELKTFIKQSLLDISEAIDEIQENNSSGIVVNPIASNNGKNNLTYVNGKSVSIKEIKFDVAVIASNDIKAEGGGGINVIGAKFGASGEVLDKNETASRIQFEIPVAFPVKEGKQ